MIVALDYDTWAEAEALVQKVGQHGDYYKVGKQLFTSEGPQVVRNLKAMGKSVFLDLKFHDIPNTVAKAVAAACALGADMVNVHASGGSAMMRAAVEAAPPATLLLAVTVLTSMGDEDLQEVGMAGSSAEQVKRLARVAQAAGCGGVVASAREIGLIREACGPDFRIVTPGIRLPDAQADDQTRTMGPAEAAAAGADFLVVGRPITAAPNPAEAHARITAILRGGRA